MSESEINKLPINEQEPNHIQHVDILLDANSDQIRSTILEAMDTSEGQISIVMETLSITERTAGVFRQLANNSGRLGLNIVECYALAKKYVDRTPQHSKKDIAEIMPITEEIEFIHGVPVVNSTLNSRIGEIVVSHEEMPLTDPRLTPEQARLRSLLLDDSELETYSLRPLNDEIPEEAAYILQERQRPLIEIGVESISLNKRPGSLWEQAQDEIRRFEYQSENTVIGAKALTGEDMIIYERLSAIDRVIAEDEALKANGEPYRGVRSRLSLDFIADDARRVTREQNARRNAEYGRVMATYAESDPFGKALKQFPMFMMEFPQNILAKFDMYQETLEKVGRRKFASSRAIIITSREDELSLSTLMDQHALSYAKDGTQALGSISKGTDLVLINNWMEDPAAVTAYMTTEGLPIFVQFLIERSLINYGMSAMEAEARANVVTQKIDITKLQSDVTEARNEYQRDMARLQDIDKASKKGKARPPVNPESIEVPVKTKFFTGAIEKQLGQQWRHSE